MNQNPETISLLQWWDFAICGVVAENAVKNRIYKDLSRRYARKNRHYHNLGHIAALFAFLDENRDLFDEPQSVALAIWYHDAVYFPLKKDNEEKSAGLAKKQMSLLGFPPVFTARVAELVLATKHHLSPEHDGDTDKILLLDMDIAVLGSPSVEYAAYSQAIRKEYAIFPDRLYKPGRRKVLETFLEAPQIYRTQLFQERFESQARKNLQYELYLLD